MVQVVTPNSGSRWVSQDGTIFRVLSTIWLDDGHWVHYIKEEDGREHSSYVESFLSRFTEILE